MAHALSDTDLIRKLLAMKIKATTAEMPAVCRTHIAIADNVFNVFKITGNVEKTTRIAANVSIIWNLPFASGAIDYMQLTTNLNLIEKQPVMDFTD